MDRISRTSRKACTEISIIVELTIKCDRREYEANTDSRVKRRRRRREWRNETKKLLLVLKILVLSAFGRGRTHMAISFIQLSFGMNGERTLHTYRIVIITMPHNNT